MHSLQSVRAEQMTPALTVAEQTELAQHEAVIERGLKTFVDVGLALLAIRDGRLYRQEYDTFEEYCRQRWGFQRHRANRLIAAAEVSQNLVPIGTIPANEAQARPLTCLEPEDQRIVWQRVVEESHGNNGKITGAAVQRMVEEMDIKTASADVHRIQIRSNNEWYTPPIYLEAARSVMGGIDVDPASSATANENVKAATFYSKDDNGLVRDWPGRVWLNPPYGSDGPKFVAELLRQFEVGIVEEAVLLVNSNSTETQWFAPLWDHVLCFVHGRINFISNVGERSGSTHGSVLVYLGPNKARFAEVFKRFGPIVQRVA